MLGYWITVVEGSGWGMLLLQVVAKLFVNLMVIGYYKHSLQIHPTEVAKSCLGRAQKPGNAMKNSRWWDWHNMQQ